MSQLIHDSYFGRLVRYFSGGKLLKHREDVDSSVLKQFTLDAHSDGSETPESQHSPDEKTAESGGDGPTYQIVSWYGPDDPENPQNWSTFTKAFITFELCFLTFSVYVGSSIFTPGTVDAMSDFHTGEVVTTLGLSLFILGYAVGPMTLAPVSEMPSIGRNPVYIYSLIAFILLQIPTALATNIAMFTIFRFITGVLGSPAIAIGGASFSEIYSPQKRALSVALWGIGAVCGPVLGPLIGGYSTEAYGWRFTIWALMIIAGASFVILFFFLPETSPKNILARRAARIRKLTGNEALTTEGEEGFKHVTVGKIAQICVVRPWILTFQEPIVFLLNMWVALIFGILFVWFYSVPLVFQGVYGFSLGSAGLAFLGLPIGVMIALPGFYWYLKKQEKQFNEKGQIIRPELRLPPSMPGGLMIPVCLLWFGWSAYADVPWIVPVLGSSLFSAGLFYILNPVLNYLSDAYPTEIASVMSGNAAIRFAFGAGFPLFAPAMFDRLGIHWSCTLLGLLSLVFAAIPFLFYHFGERIRRASKRARHD